MLAAAGSITTTATEESSHTPMITTLYDLLSALQDDTELWEEDVVTAAVVDLCNRGRVQFLDISTRASLF